ncbi:hypothetical protein ETAA8_45160 [Anatilimnocola aggregata]|uniref:Uncharacterized protein n=1 Tax=Anatilimnocola aggregata TaxID=2528021 RepID=A0A517YGQ0_9BACT|nr:hypothetical protein [Anatilimnocola aggregata]QDU29406.1 hypothetical protein ETAA8_45160 [Anatilimnocola aggregata]
MPSTKLQQAFAALLAEKGLEVPPLRPDFASSEFADEYREAMRQEGLGESEVEESIKLFAEGSSGHGFEKLLYDLSVEVENDIRACGCTLDEEVFAAEFPTGDLNAQILPRNGGFLVLVNTGLIMTTFLILKTFARSLTFRREDTPPPPFDDEAVTRTVNELLPIIQAYHFGGDVRLAKRKEVLTGHGVTVLSRLLWQTEKFVLAHEYAHLLAGHVGSQRVAQFNTPAGNLEFVVLDHQQEYDADLQALTILMASANWAQPNSDAKYRIAGPFVLLCVNDMLSRVGDAMYFKPIGYSPTHPTDANRLEHLRVHVFRKYGQDLYEYADLCTQWIRQYTNFIVTKYQEGQIFDPEIYAGLYRNMIAAKASAISSEELDRIEIDIGKVRSRWITWRGVDDLHEAAFRHLQEPPGQ